MARNEVHRRGVALSAPVPAGTLAGAPVRVGAFATGRNGVCQTDEGSVTKTVAGRTVPNSSGNPNGFASVLFEGAHRFTTGIAIANLYDPVYITSANALSASASGNQFFGWALNTKAATSGPLDVEIAN